MRCAWGRLAQGAADALDGGRQHGCVGVGHTDHLTPTA